ncbi:MAG: glycosyltransferase family 2 protein, partial [Pyrinomonadaceae bacterium]
MPVYNGENYIAEAIDSLLKQTFEDFELIIADNASIDGTEEICRSYARRDTRVRYVRNKTNIGAAKNCNLLVKISSGEYFKWAAHDDICAPDYLSRCVGILDRDPSVVLCHTQTAYVDDDGALLEADEATGAFIDRHGCHWGVDTAKRMGSMKASERFEDFLLRTVNIFEIFGLMRRSVLEKTPLFRRYYAADRAL